MNRVQQAVEFGWASRACELVTDFARWWVGELFRSVPQNLAHRLLRTRQRFVVRVRDDGIEVRNLNGADENWSCFDETGTNLQVKIESAALLLPAAIVLRRVLELPYAAVSTLQETVSFQIGRITPFKSEEVRHVARLLDRDRRRQVIRAEVAVVPRPALEQILTRIEAHRIRLSAILVEGDRLQPSLDFLSQLGGRVKPPERRVRTRIFAGALILVLAIPLLNAYRIHVSAQALLAETAKVATIARQASATQSQLDELIAADAFLPDRLRAPQAIEIFDALTRLTPDSAWVFRLEIRSNEATLSGFTSDLPALLRELATSPFAAPELTSPVVQSLVGGQTRFDLRVRHRVSP